MNNRELIKTITPQEKEMIERVMDRAREKAKGLEPLTQKKREGDGIKLPLYSYMEVGVYGN